MTRLGDQAIIKLAENGLTRDQVKAVILDYQKVVTLHSRIASEHQAMVTKLEAVLKEKQEATQPDEP
jgi:hypothetical protein